MSLRKSWMSSNITLAPIKPSRFSQLLNILSRSIKRWAEIAYICGSAGFYTWNLQYPVSRLYVASSQQERSLNLVSGDNTKLIEGKERSENFRICSKQPATPFQKLHFLISSSDLSETSLKKRVLGLILEVVY